MIACPARWTRARVARNTRSANDRPVFNPAVSGRPDRFIFRARSDETLLTLRWPFPDALPPSFTRRIPSLHTRRRGHGLTVASSIFESGQGPLGGFRIVDGFVRCFGGGGGIGRIGTQRR